MLHRINQGAILSVQKVARTSTAWATFTRDVMARILTTAHHTLSLFGLSALIVIGVLLSKPELAQHIRDLLPIPHQTAPENNESRLQLRSALDMPHQQLKAEYQAINAPISSIPIRNAAVEEKKSATIDRSTLKQQQWVTSWLSKRYRVAGDAANMLVATSYLTAKEIKIDPLLILAVMAIESGFNPFAESPMGAQGLMQVMSKIHHEKFQDFGGVKEALNPHANIRVGALILKDYVTRGGSIEAGLKSYVGASAFETDAGYGSRVMAEYKRLKEVANGKALPAQISNPIAPIRPRIEEVKPDSANTTEAKADQATAPHTTGKTEQLAAL